MYKVAVFGAGNGGCALAADISKLGHSVVLNADPNHARNIAAIVERGGVDVVSEHDSTHVPIGLATTDLSATVSGAQYLFVCLPTYAHESLFEKLVPLLEDGQVVILVSGNLSSIKLHKCLQEKRPSLKVHVGETNTLPYACRVSEPSVVNIFATKKKISLAFFSNTGISTESIETVKKFFPCELRIAKNLIEISLLNNNGVQHPVTTVLNTGWVETTKGDFYFYKDGISPSVAKVMEEIDRERLKIADAYALKLPDILSLNEEFYGFPCPDLLTFARNPFVHNRVKAAPQDMKARYVSEDVLYVLVPWLQFAMSANLKLKVIPALVELASVINGVDYMKEAQQISALEIELCS